MFGGEHVVVFVQTTPVAVVPHTTWAWALRDSIVTITGLAHAATAACFRNFLRASPASGICSCVSTPNPFSTSSRSL